LSFFQLFVLAVVQGLTEWLPISSSGHLILGLQAVYWRINALFVAASVVALALWAIYARIVSRWF